jgi:hypothetical protein
MGGSGRAGVRKCVVGEGWYVVRSPVLSNVVGCYVSVLEGGWCALPCLGYFEVFRLLGFCERLGGGYRVVTLLTYWFYVFSFSLFLPLGGWGHVLCWWWWWWIWEVRWTG